MHFAFCRGRSVFVMSGQTIQHTRGRRSEANTGAILNPPCGGRSDHLSHMYLFGGRSVCLPFWWRAGAPRRGVFVVGALCPKGECLSKVSVGGRVPQEEASFRWRPFRPNASQKGGGGEGLLGYEALDLTKDLKDGTPLVTLSLVCLAYPKPL